MIHQEVHRLSVWPHEQLRLRRRLLRLAVLLHGGVITVFDLTGTHKGLQKLQHIMHVVILFTCLGFQNTYYETTSQ